jgi:hypothetical protein
MRKAFGVLELLVAVVVVIIIYFACFHSQYGKTNPFADNASEIKTKQQLVDDKLKEIENTKMLKEKIERNLNEGY